jgi:hypothetical protein
MDDTSPTLPPLYAQWIQAMLPGPIPPEKQATCDRCAMVPPGGAHQAATPEGGAIDGFFSPETKCCTYMPQLSNFLVGRILNDPDESARRGRETVEKRIEAGAGVTPLGLQRTRLYDLLYAKSPAAFGRAKALLCPHYLADDGGKCGVWSHRESTCATWFCKFGRGQTGKTFWQRLHDMLCAAENSLSRHCLLELGLDASALAQLIPTRARAKLTALDRGIGVEDLDGQLIAPVYRALWGSWVGREREFYPSCAEVVSALSWGDVMRLGGTELGVLSRLVLDAYTELTSSHVPERLRPRRLSVIYTSPERACLIGYSSLDPLSVPKALADSLHCFDGRPTAEALRAITKEHHLTLSTGAVRKLVDFGVLEAVAVVESD